MGFEELVKRISPKLKGIAYKLNGSFTFFNEDDLYQEALVHLWHGFQAGKLDDKTESYILQGCYFYLKNYLRKVRPKVSAISIETAIDEAGQDLEEIIAFESRQPFWDYLDNKVLTDEILNNGLTSREKEVLSFCLEGLTLREIGKRLGISHVRIVKIRANIQRKIGYLLDRP